MSRKNTLMAPELIKRKCLLKICCTKASTPSCMLIMSPRKPCAGTAMTKRTSNRLRGRVLPLGTTPKIRSACLRHVIWRIWCQIARLGSVLKGQFLQGLSKLRREDQQPHPESSENVHLWSSQSTGPPQRKKSSRRGNVLLWKPTTYKNYRPLAHLKKYH